MKKRNFENDVIQKVEDKVREDYIKTSIDGEFRILKKRLGLWRYKELKDKLPNFNLHPDIDILLGSKNITQGKWVLTGVEAKTVYPARENKLNVKFYDGLDEAIALLRFGLDAVRFFQIFLLPPQEGKERDEMSRAYFHYSESVRDIIRTLDLPVNYTPAFDVYYENGLLPGPIQVLDLENTSSFPEDQRLILSNRPNPFLNSPLEYPKVIREFIVSRFTNKLK